MKQTLLWTVAAHAVAASADLTIGQYSSRMAIPVPGLFDRQVHICQPVDDPVTCARSCGAGFIQCISFPHCYNPGRGDICCSDGTHCPAGTYCTDNACCPNGTPLSDCGATVSLSVIPNPGTSTSASTSTSTSISSSTSTSKYSFTVTESSTSESTATTSAETTAISTIAPIYTPSLSLPSSSVVTSPNISTTSAIVPFTGGAAGMGLAYGGVGVVVGGVAILLML